jgi:hypothetical protein
MLLEKKPPFLFLFREITVDDFCESGLLIFLRLEDICVVASGRGATSEIIVVSRLISERIIL